MDLDPNQAPPPPNDDSDATYEASQIADRTEARDRAQAAQAAAKATFPAGQPLRIRNDYVPRAQAASKRAASTATTALCPNCKQQIPFDELEMHMRSKTHCLPFQPPPPRENPERELTKLHQSSSWTPPTAPSAPRPTPAPPPPTSPPPTSPRT